MLTTEDSNQLQVITDQMEGDLSEVWVVCMCNSTENFNNKYE